MTDTARPRFAGWRGVNHLAMVTPDMEATTRFFTHVLGMDLLATLGNGDPREPYPYRHYFFGIAEGNTIAFFEWPDVQQGPTKPAGLPADGVRFDHLSFNVASVEDLSALRQRLIDADVSVSDVVDHTVIHSIYFDDPVTGASLEASVWVQDIDAVPYWGDPDPVPAARAAMAARPVDAKKPNLPPELAGP